MHGLTQDKVVLAPHSTSWSTIFKHEKQRLVNILGKDNFVDIQHVGSTSIPFIDSKPIIDIAVAVKSFEESKKLIKPMTDAGYTYRGENGIPRRHYFIKITDNKSLFHVHMNEQTSKDWNDQIYFRDFLIAHREKALEYQSIKRTLSEKYPEDRISYTNGKNEFIQSILKTKQ